MDINLVKNVINGVNLVEIGRFGENGQNWVILDHDVRDENDPIIPENIDFVHCKRLEYLFKSISYGVC